MKETEVQTHGHIRCQCTPRRADAPQALARIALLGGLLSVAMATTECLLYRRRIGGDAIHFYFSWLGVFLTIALAGALLVWREAQRRGAPEISPAVRLALGSLSPGFLAGTVLGFCVTLTSGQPLLTVTFWLIFYGLSLLGTMHFAPGSFVVLGWAFLLTGLAAIVYCFYHTLLPDMGLPMGARTSAPLLMGTTFGFYHLIYAACVWPRGTVVLRMAKQQPLPGQE
jgi:hypothetical protein